MIDQSLTTFDTFLEREKKMATWRCRRGNLALRSVMVQPRQEEGIISIWKAAILSETSLDDNLGWITKHRSDTLIGLSDGCSVSLFVAPT